MGWVRCGLGTPSNILALPTPSEASGAIARFNTDLTENLLSAVAEFSASQASGTPTPASPIPIVGVDKVNVTRTGKNLFNPNNVLDAYLNTSAVIRASASTKLVFVECKPNTTYTVSKTAGQRFQVAYCDSLPEAELQCQGMITNGTASSITITTGATAKYLVAYIYHSSYDTITAEQMLASVQIELGNQSTTYEPYNGTTALINLGGTYYGGSVDAVTGKITLTHGVYTFDGSETWTQYVGGVGVYFTLALSAAKHANEQIVICDHYQGQLSGAENSNYPDLSTWLTNTENYKRLYVKNSNFESTSDAQSGMNGVTVVYPLATPIVVYASNTAEIPTINGLNQVYADTGDVAVKYFETVGHKI